MVSQRTTILFQSLNAIDTDNLLLDAENIKISGRLFKSRQDRLTFQKQELPSDLKQLLDDMYMLRIQWTNSDSNRDLLYQNYGIDGFSIHLVPGTAQYEPVFDKVGQFTKLYFNIPFDNATLVSTATSASFHSTQSLKSSIIDRFLRKLVPNGLDRISFLTDFEIVYEDEKLIIQWISLPYDLSISKSPNLRKEIAIVQTKDLNNDLEISGIRTVLDEEDPLSPTKTLLFVKPRHHSTSDILNLRFEEPIGLHPTLKITGFNNITEPPHSSCELFLHNTISSELFFDNFQYDQKTLKLLNSWGEQDLEAPIWKTSQFGSYQLLQINYDHVQHTDEIEIKFHSRYLKPSQPNEFQLVTPEVFWACDASQYLEDFEELKNNPFESFGLGYESYFEDNTVFYHLNKNNRVLPYRIPRGDMKDFDLVQFITLGSVIIGVSYIFLKIFRAINRPTVASHKKEK